MFCSRSDPVIFVPACNSGGAQTYLHENVSKPHYDHLEGEIPGSGPEEAVASRYRL